MSAVRREKERTLEHHLLGEVDEVKGDSTSDQEGGHGADKGNGPSAHVDGVDLRMRRGEGNDDGMQMCRK